MSSHQREPSGPTTATAAACLIAVMVIPELANLAPTDELSWTLYLALNELTKAALCLLLAAAIPRAKYGGWLASVWFTTQAADELTNGNLFSEQQWEYPLLAVLTIIIAILTKE